MTDRKPQPWPFAPSLRFSSMGLLAVVLSTFVTGTASVALLLAAAVLTTLSVVRFLQALRVAKTPPPAEQPAAESNAAGKELPSRDYA